jgi:hypothetical protein
VRQQNAHGYAVHARLSVASAVSVEPGTTTTRRGGTPCPKRINAPARPHAQPRDGAARQRRGGNECRRLDANNEWRRQPPHIRLPSRSWSKRRLRSALVDLDARASLSQATGDRADDRDLQARSARSLLLRLQGSSARRRYRVPCKRSRTRGPSSRRRRDSRIRSGTVGTRQSSGAPARSYQRRCGL